MNITKRIRGDIRGSIVVLTAAAEALFLTGQDKDEAELRRAISILNAVECDVAVLQCIVIRAERKRKVKP